MELAGRSEPNRITLHPLGYELDTPVGDEWDDNWLVISGAVTTPEQRWSFRDPCLLVGEAQLIADWLEAVAARRQVTSQPDEHGGPRPSLVFTEPNLALSVTSYTADGAVVRVHLALEALPPQPIVPPGTAGDDGGRHRSWLDVELTLHDAAAAAMVWRSELAGYPRR
jgi:hypothetical protein